jgi:DDE superfamily endonuclease
LIIGFAVGSEQASYVVVDSTLRQKYQATPGHQEWVIVVKCICKDGGVIPPLVTFKGETILSNWIPHPTSEDWHFLTNTKGWTSNAHGEEWLMKCFNPATAAKANGHT